MVAMHIAINSAPHQQSLQASYKGKKGCVWLLVGVVAQWQSAGGLS